MNQKQSVSVSQKLIQPVSMVLKGGQPDQDLLSILQRVSVNLAQLIRFNSEKQKRRQGIVYFRKSRKNEPPFPVLIELIVHSKPRKWKLAGHLAPVA